MSLFGELDIASANENPFFKPDGTYHCELVSAEVKTSKAGNKGFALDYIIKSGPKEGKRIQEWKPIPHVWQLKGFESEQAMNIGGPSDDHINQDNKIKENAERSMAFLKQRLKDFGIPVENVTGVKIHEGDSSGDPFAY